MRGRLASLRGRAVIADLERGGFYLHHLKRSHHVLRHPSKASRPRCRLCPGRDLPAGTLPSIIKQVGLTTDEFLDLL